MFEHMQTSIPECVQILAPRFEDERGRFIKILQFGALPDQVTSEPYVEQFYTVSRKNVLRGLHFQLPPADHGKLVYCSAGTVLDAVVDLRADSPTFKKFELLELSAERANILYIPKGCAHGFLTITESATMHYCVTSGHSPALDAGIRWDSVGIPWPIHDPVLSRRDRALPPLAEFKIPRWSP